MTQTEQAAPFIGEFTLVTLHRTGSVDQGCGRGSGRDAARSVGQGFAPSLGQDDLLDAVARLLVDAVGRREALGLLGPLTRADYRRHLDALAADAERGDAGLVAAVGAGGSVLGAAQWTRSPYATRRVLAELDRVSVAPTARGLGVGRAVVEQIAVDAAGQGIELLMLEVRGNNHGAIALYEGCGFTRSGLLPNAVADGSARHDVILMCRELARPDSARLYGSEVVGAGASELRRRA